MDEDEDIIKEGEKKSKTVRIPADIWNPIIKQSRKHHCKTSQVIVTILGAYFDENQESLLPYQCPICRKINEPGTNYCGGCGNPLNSHAAEEMQNFREYVNKFKNDPAVMAEYTEWLKKRKK